MAKQFKMTKNGETVYPQSITSAIADSFRKKTLAAVLDDTDTKVEKVSTDLRAAQTSITSLQEADKLTTDLKADATVGKVPNGSTFAAGTPIKSVIDSIFSYASPSCSVNTVVFDPALAVTSGMTQCSGTTVKLASFKPNVANTGSVSEMTVTAGTFTKTYTAGNIPTSVITIDAASQPTFTGLTTNGGTFTISISGTSTLGSKFNSTYSVKAYLPVFSFKSANTTEATIKTACTTAATSAKTIYAAGTERSESITGNWEAGSCFCVALPSHLSLTGIGTAGDFGFGTQVKPANATKLTGVSVTVNGVTGTYTVYYIKTDTAQTGLQFMAKFK